MATPESRPEVRRDSGKQLGDGHAGAGSFVPGARAGRQGQGDGIAPAAKPALIDGQLPLTEPRCGGRNPEKGMCQVRDTCARYTQLAKDRASGRKDYVNVPVWWTCIKSMTLMYSPPGMVHDPAAAEAQRIKAARYQKQAALAPQEKQQYAKDLARKRRNASLNWGKP